MNDRTTLLREIDEAWQPYAAALAAATDEDLLGIAEGTWTRKDLVAHVAWWETSSADTLEAIGDERDPPWRDETTDETNARVETEFKDVSAADVRRLAGEAHARLVERIASMDDEDLATPGRFPWMNGEPLAEMIRGDTTRHYPDHVAPLTVT